MNRRRFLIGSTALAITPLAPAAAVPIVKYPPSLPPLDPFSTDDLIIRATERYINGYLDYRKLTEATVRMLGMDPVEVLIPGVVDGSDSSRGSPSALGQADG